MPRYAKICQHMPRYANICQDMPTYAKICQRAISHLVLAQGFATLHGFQGRHVVKTHWLTPAWSWAKQPGEFDSLGSSPKAIGVQHVQSANDIVQILKCYIILPRCSLSDDATQKLNLPPLPKRSEISQPCNDSLQLKARLSLIQRLPAQSTTV